MVINVVIVIIYICLSLLLFLGFCGFTDLRHGLIFDHHDPPNSQYAPNEVDDEYHMKSVGVR